MIVRNSILAGDLNLSGSMKLTQTTGTSTTASGLYGLLMDGQVNGNILLPSGGTVLINGAGATGLSIQGTGVTGSISVGGTLETVGISTTTTTGSNTSSTTIFPEAGSALVVSANVGQGIAVLGPLTSSDTTTTRGSISSQGTSTSPAVVIAPSENAIVTTPTAPMTIGVYADTIDPGFSFYNRGTIQQSSANPDSDTMAMQLVGYSNDPANPTASFPTVLTGGIFNAGSIAATSTTTGTTASGANATALYIGQFVTIGKGSGKIAAVGNEIGDQAALVNSISTGEGTISATTSGTRGGTANALYIAADATLPSIINSGTISASASTTDLTIVNPVQAFAIVDNSGSLTSITNTGTISAQATTLDTPLTCLGSATTSSCAVAINLSGGNLLTPSGLGVTINDTASSTKAASITGTYAAIIFGTGDKQIVNIVGAGPDETASIIGNIQYGSGSKIGGDQLNIGAFGELVGGVTAPNGVAVDVQQNGVLDLQNANTAAGVAATTLNATNFKIEDGGTVSLSVSESLTSTGVVAATQSATIAPGANLGVAYASFVPQGSDQYVLITAPTGHLVIAPATVNLYNTSLKTNTISGGALPFLFESANLATEKSGSLDELVLNVVPKTSAQLGLTAGSYGAQLFALTNTALGKDDVLGSAMVNGIATTKQAQAAYNSFAPDVTGGSRAIAISITDQATGVVAARQRSLRLYGTEEGEETLWAQEFVQMMKDPGRGAIDPNTASSAAQGAVATGYKVQSGFKDHGFGFAMGMDGGSPKYGWYGGALTFYTGDVGELARDDHTNEQWYLLSGYSAWRGKGLFFDSKLDVGYGSFKGKRYISLDIPNGTSTSIYTREADNTHAGELLSGGFTTGGIFSYGATTLMPQLSVDGLVMREEGYTEKNPGTATTGDGFDLQVQPYYAQSLRIFLGAAVRYDLNLWDFYLQPEARAGYRYDVFNDPVKLKAAFAYAAPGTSSPGASFTMVGPDPSQGNFVVGGSLASTTDTWTMGLNFDLVRGSSGGFDEVGTFNLVGRI